MPLKLPVMQRLPSAAMAIALASLSPVPSVPAARAQAKFPAASNLDTKTLVLPVAVRLNVFGPGSKSTE